MFRLKFIASGSLGNSCFITDGNTGLLIDAGIDVKELRKHISLLDITAIFLTHEHKDHSKSVVELANKLQVPLLSGKKTHEVVSASLHNHLKFSVVSGKLYQIGSLRIKPFSLEHDAVDPLGLMIANEHNEKIMFASDTGYMRSLHVNANVYVLEANYNENYIRGLYDTNKLSNLQYYRLIGDDGHMSTDDAVEFANYNTTEDSTIFFHHIGNIKDKEFLKRVDRNVFLVDKGISGLEYQFGYIQPKVPF